MRRGWEGQEVEVEQEGRQVRLVGEGEVRGTRGRLRNSSSSSSKRPIRRLTHSDNGRILGHCTCRYNRSSMRRMVRRRLRQGPRPRRRGGRRERMHLRRRLLQRRFTGRASPEPKDATRFRGAVLLKQVDQPKGA